MKLAQASADYLQELANLAADLASHGVVVDECHAHFGAFGSFIVVARADHGRWRFAWDGRDSALTVEYTDESLNQRSARDTVQSVAKIRAPDAARDFIRTFSYRRPVCD